MRVAEIFMNPSILNLKENIMNNAHAQTGKMVVAKVQTLANKNRIATAVVLASCVLVADPALAAAADTAFLPLYTFFSNAATGNLTRGICLLGGIIGAGTAAVNGKILLAATGAGIAIFGMLSPQIINAFFTGAML